MADARPTTFSLADRCPRLALARDQHDAEIAMRRAMRARLRRRWAKLNWLVGHRDLQLHRAMARGDGRYIDQRLRKLEQARAEFAQVGEALKAAA